MYTSLVNFIPVVYSLDSLFQ